jgi:UTP-glucose-1-phosphate uridylyltransferase/mevalonate kinase
MKIFVPGRICLFGEHSDWAGGYRRINAEVEKGYTLICGTNQGIYAEVEPHPTALVLTSTTPDGRVVGPREIPLELNALLEEAQQGRFFSYAAGVAYQVLTHYRVRGLSINNTRMDLPIKRGLSSSAAICVLTARAFNRIYDLKLTTRGEMELAYQGEITTPSRCGRMDQGCAFGDRAVLMEFDGERLSTEEVRPAKDLHFVIVNLNASKDTLEILKRLNRSYPFAEGDLERGVQQLLGPINKRIVGEARTALEAGDAERIGALMTEAQAFFDRYAGPACPEELTAPVLHRVLAHEPLRPHIWGGKGVGSQGDGTAQFMARSASDQQAVVEILERDLGMPALPLTLGTGPKVHRALIPAAGFGTRLFPASKATKKELFPIVDRDGIAKPAILLIVEEALDAGIEEVVIVVQKEDLEEFRSFFNTQVSIENYNKLSPASQAYARSILDMGRHVRFVTQSTQQGLGDAVYCARAAMADEPFLLMLGDHLYRSNGPVSCARQVVDAYQQSGTSVVGLRPTPESEVGSFGVATGVWVEPGRRLNITEFAEKPTADYARSRLQVPGIPDGQYLTIFGQYVIKPLLFEYLEEHIQHNVRERGEFQLTSALDRLRQDDGFQGLMVDGFRFDIGLPNYYLETLATFSRP